MSRLLTVTVSNPTHDTLNRYLQSLNTQLPDHLKLSKSKFVDACIKAALESKGVIIVANQIVEMPIDVIDIASYIPPITVKKPSLPPL